MAVCLVCECSLGECPVGYFLRPNQTQTRVVRMTRESVGEVEGGRGLMG